MSRGNFGRPRDFAGGTKGQENTLGIPGRLVKNDSPSESPFFGAPSSGRGNVAGDVFFAYNEKGQSPHMW